MTSITETTAVFFKQFPTSTYQAGKSIIAAGQTSAFFYVIESGAVKMSSTAKTGKTLVLHIFFPAAFFSLLDLVHQQPNQYDFVTIVPTTVRKIPKAELITFLKHEPEVLYDLQLRLLRGLDGLLKRIEQAALSPANDQVASLLVYFASHFAESSKLTVKLTHQEIADWLGLSRENVTLQMNLLATDGLIAIEDHFIKILDLDQLKHRALAIF